MKMAIGRETNIHNIHRHFLLDRYFSLNLSIALFFLSSYSVLRMKSHKMRASFFFFRVRARLSVVPTFNELNDEIVRCLRMLSVEVPETLLPLLICVAF